MTSTRSTTRPARTLADGETIADTLDALPATYVKGSNLRPGMILLDEFDCAAAVVDHRIGSAGARTGAVRYLVENVEKGSGWTEAVVGGNARIKVAAR